jgi:multicomponent Na+:H+ antiporter subunit B
VIGPHASPIMRVIGALVTPFVLMFGIYVTAHGHYGPGGGFAGGVIMAVAVVVVRMVLPTSISHRLFPPGLGVEVGVAMAVMGAMVSIVDLLGATVPDDDTDDEDTADIDDEVAS